MKSNYNREGIIKNRIFSKEALYVGYQEIVLSLIESFKYVPYKLNKYSKYEKGHTYWNKDICKLYTVIETNGEMTTVKYSDGVIEDIFTPLNVKRNFEMIPFEYKDGSVIRENKSYTAAEIKALLFTGVINKDEAVRSLIESYFKKDHTPNDYTYYFVKDTKSYNGEYRIKLTRDMVKSPHNFYNIKTARDALLDSRISTIEFSDKNRNKIYGANIDSEIKVLSVEWISGGKFRVILDCVLN